MVVLDREEILREHELLRSELRNLQWRTMVLLLGSTFLVIFWCSTFAELLLKTERIFVFRSVFSFPLILNAASWMVWLMPALLLPSTSRSLPDPALERDYASEYERRLLDRVQVLRIRVSQFARYSRMLYMIVASEFCAVGSLTAFVFIGFGSRL